MGVERMNVAERLGPKRHAGEGHIWTGGSVFSLTLTYMDSALDREA